MATISPSGNRTAAGTASQPRRCSGSVDIVAMVVLATSLCLLSGAMCARRAQGALERPLGPFGICLVLLSVMVLAVAIRAYATWARERLIATGEWLAWGLWFSPLAFTVLTLVAVTLPGTPWVWVSFLSVVLGISEIAAATWAHRLLFDSAGTRHLHDRSGSDRSGDVDATPPAAAEPEPEPDSIVDVSEYRGPELQRLGVGFGDETAGDDGRLDEEAFVFPRGVTQQVTRFHTEEGQDIVTAVSRAEFRAGERQLSLHIAFCPPFDTIPELSVDHVGGSDCTLKTSQVLHHGVRVDVRRQGDCDQPGDVLVELTAMGHVPDTTT